MNKEEAYISINNVTVRCTYELPKRIRGFTYHDDDGHEFIMINGNLSPEAQRETLKHEVNHLMRGDMYNPEYKEY